MTTTTTGRFSRLPIGGTNLFQEIKAVCSRAEKSGQKLYRLSIGQPSGPAFESAREVASEAISSSIEAWHEYQDNGCVPCLDFAQRFVQTHVSLGLSSGFFRGKVDYLPIPGIKPMLGLIPLACGGREMANVVTMTNPGYPVPATWCDYLDIQHRALRTDPLNSFRPDILKELDQGDKPFTLMMLNFPHNPSGQIATWDYWRELCRYCEELTIRLFNDASYCLLNHNQGSCTLTEVAVDFPELSWLEAFSVSKEIGNGTGWRVGAIIGSPDFVGDLKTIKGNTDSGFVAPMAYGALRALESSFQEVRKVRQVYGQRIEILISILEKRGMKLAVYPGAGFFTLWLSPKYAFGREMKDARDFNLAMIEETGVVGVHFDPYIRYAVVGPVEEWIEQIDEAFAAAQVSY